jgi:hypothetical protein
MTFVIVNSMRAAFIRLDEIVAGGSGYAKRQEVT